MKTNRYRNAAKEYYLHILQINGDKKHHLSQKVFYIENIGKGGFRFVSDVEFEMEDRIQVLLRFPDKHSQKVLGRICYIEKANNGLTAYGFSVIDGFYSMISSAA